MAHTFTPKQVADQLHVTTQSVRRYTDKLGKHLSAGANGRPRVFTAEDVYILKTASTWLSGGMTYHDVDDRLGSLTMPDHVTDLVLVDVDETAETAPAIPEALAILNQLTDAVMALTAAQASTTGIYRRLDELDDRQTLQHTAHMADVQSMADRLRKTEADFDARLAMMRQETAEQVSRHVPVRTAVMLILVSSLLTLAIGGVVFLIFGQ